MKLNGVSDALKDGEAMDLEKFTEHMEVPAPNSALTARYLPLLLHATYRSYLKVSIAPSARYRALLVHAI